MKILFVGYRDSSHSSAGGYDRIIGFPNSDSLMGENVPFGFIPVSRRGKFLNLFFLNLIYKFKKRRYDLVHFFYGEMLPFHKRTNNNKVVATIHMKIDINDNKFIKKLQAADGIITLSSSQAKLLRSKYGVNAFFIPHGFNKPYFKYKEGLVDSTMINVVVSGKNYRDERSLIDVVSFCKKNREDVFFHLLGQPERIKKQLADYNNVKCYPRLTDDDYFSIMSSCDYNFLPLTYATANNTLLEAEFLGVKSILPNIDGVLDYAAEKPLNFFYNEREELYDLFANLEKCNKNSELIIFAKRFCWDNIYQQLQQFYNLILHS